MEDLEKFNPEDDPEIESAKRFKAMSDQQRLTLYMKKINGELKTDIYDDILDWWWSNRY